jgi:bifunctional non-homologous end joining protein LigD
MRHLYLPMNAKSAQGPFSSDEWLFEIKWDGIRAIAYIDEGLSVMSRNGKELTGVFPELAELPGLAPNTVLDGEIIAMSGGRPDIQELLPKLQSFRRIPGSAGNAPITYIVFDILEQDGEPLVTRPLIERRKILLQRVKEGPHVVISEPIESMGVEYYRAAVLKNLEGVVAKRKDSTYEPGVRSGNWLKIKQHHTCDCVIAGYTKGEGGRSPHFGALVLGLYKKPDMTLVDVIDPGNTSLNGIPGNNPGELIYIGKVGSGFTDRNLTALKDLFTRYETGTPQLSGVDRAEKVAWLKPALVCEVSYQSVTRERKLRIPGFVRLRSDKNPEECTIDQLDMVSAPGADTHVQGQASTGPIPQHNPVSEAAGLPEGKTLRKYREIRDFAVTTEPEGDTVKNEEGNYFVVHEHHARNLHFDVRLEREGVLKSWAVPKGVPLTPGEKHLAVGVEDHPLEYGHFEGTIPTGQYGAGTVSIWDNGHYETKHWDNDKIEITFHGKRLEGPYVLVRFNRAGKNDWLMFRGN